MSAPNVRIVFSRVIPALQADRNGVIAIQRGLDNSAARSRVASLIQQEARANLQGATKCAAPQPAITRPRSGVRPASACR